MGSRLAERISDIRKLAQDHRHVIVLALIGVVERLIFWLVYAPIPYPDTASYMRIAGVLSNFNLEGFDGTRVIGYPLFLALLGRDPKLVWLAQMGLGLAISILIFLIILRATQRKDLALLGGLTYDLLAGQVFFEANLLTETLTSFLIVVSLALFTKLFVTKNHTSKLLLAMLLGVSSSLAGLVRPLFFFLPLWFFPFVYLSTPGRLRNRLASLIVFSIAPLLLLGGWLAYMRTAFHVLSPTAMGGYYLVQHTGVFFELLPDDNALIRDSYLEVRDMHIAEKGNQTNAIWDAIPILEQATGLGFYDLSRELQKISLQLIKENPGYYLKNVIGGWIGFWKAPVFWSPTSIASELMRPIASFWVGMSRGLAIAANFLFLIISSIYVLSSKARKRLDFDYPMIAVFGLIWTTSIIQTLVDHGDNARFLIPLQMTMVYFLLRAIFSWRQSNRIKEIA